MKISGHRAASIFRSYDIVESDDAQKALDKQGHSNSYDFPYITMFDRKEGSGWTLGHQSPLICTS